MFFLTPVCPNHQWTHSGALAHGDLASFSFNALQRLKYVSPHIKGW